MVTSFMRSSREFMMRVLAEMLIKKRKKIRCGIRAEGDDSSASIIWDRKYSYGLKTGWIIEAMELFGSYSDRIVEYFADALERA